MESHGQSPWYLHEIPSYACLRVAASAEVGQGFGGLFARGDIRRSTRTPTLNDLTEAYVFIHGQNLWPSV
jgi:hypothetical protein